MRIAVYWDIDGTLLLSPPGRADLYRSTIASLGGTPVLPSQPRDGLTDRRVGELYLDAAGMPLALIDDFLAELDRQSVAYYVEHPREQMPGALAAVADVAGRGWRQAVMSGNTPTRIRTKLATAGIDPDLFDPATSVSGGSSVTGVTWADKPVGSPVTTSWWSSGTPRTISWRRGRPMPR
ncbi:haloacid dehalogenase-like hydrolase [Raineyella fluvialis]|uniref:Uncharacterized protein n=1 Tax=Raineyella fluvialis TaxID=2662261 RepID=A0A5Q2F7H6_9ACTN|nr:haloacid dehalogenase-like hydrolase [Raineyella fluvialis]QGF22789.1 hypothetical protein Rai3103_02850 [Raineyella fluvialis]